jgi:hypothetical protein
MERLMNPPFPPPTSAPLEEQFYESERARLQRWIPWTHLFRAFRLATRWQNLALAILGVMFLAMGRWGISWMPFSEYAGKAPDGVARAIWPWDPEFLTPSLPTIAEASFGRAAGDPFAVLGDCASHATTVLNPLYDFVAPGSRLFRRRNSWSDIADVWLNILLVVAVGSVIGGAIARRVAVEFAGLGEPGFRESLRFSITHFPFSFGAPLISVIGVGLLVLFGRIVAWIGRIPGVGETMAALGWGLLLLISLVMALIVLGVAAAWPLMVAAHSTEGTDGFDALNRAYNYVFVRPWYALWLTLLAMLYGAVLIYFVVALAGAVVHLTGWIAAGPLSDESLARITSEAPSTVASARIPERVIIGAPSRTLGGFWHRGLATLLTAFVYSFFWTAATLIYFLLRKSADACDLDRVYIPLPPRSKDELPLAGIPAADRREQQESA